MNGTVFSAWQSYAREIVPAEAPAIQREECRRAFYAGAAAMLALVYEAVDSADGDECERNLQQLDEEMTQMSAELRLDAPAKGST